jgi:hypothetical protein
MGQGWSEGLDPHGLFGLTLEAMALLGRHWKEGACRDHVCTGGGQSRSCYRHSDKEWG